MDNIFDLSEYDYTVPQELIAQEPLLSRDQSRLLILERSTGKITHDRFFNIKNYLKKDDCLVLNDTKVVPARLFGNTRKSGAAVEILVLGKNHNNTWEVMMKNSRRVDEGSFVIFGADLQLKVVKKKGKTAEVEFNLNDIMLKKTLWKNGTIPLPPYIKHDTAAEIHKERYQTVYAKNEGARAAPTAGLHFTPGLLNEIRDKNIETASVTLHVGMGTFESITEDDIRKHKMHEEEYIVDAKNASIINESKGRIIAAGTTSLRVLESAFTDGKIPKIHGKTGIYIYPGYKFKIVQGLITNFHLPKTTLLALVYAFAGSLNVKRAYAEAVREKYRFFSYGDAMLII